MPEPDLPALAAEALKLGYPPAGGAARIGVFGILRPQKGQINALKAAAELNRKGLRFTLHLFGDGPDRLALEAAASELGLKDIAVFHGEVAGPAPHMYAMDIVLIPSLFESFGYAAIEAFSMRRPVVAAAVGGLREIIKDGATGLLAPPGDFNLMAAAVERLLSDPGLRAHLGENAFSDFVGRFTAVTMLAGLTDTYLRLAD